MRRFTGLLLPLLSAPLAAHAFNKCRDAAGHVVYSDLPCASVGAEGGGAAATAGEIDEPAFAAWLRVRVRRIAP